VYYSTAHRHTWRPQPSHELMASLSGKDGTVKGMMNGKLGVARDPSKRRVQNGKSTEGRRQVQLPRKEVSYEYKRESQEKNKINIPFELNSDRYCDGKTTLNAYTLLVTCGTRFATTTASFCFRRRMSTSSHAPL